MYLAASVPPFLVERLVYLHWLEEEVEVFYRLRKEICCERAALKTADIEALSCENKSPISCHCSFYVKPLLNTKSLVLLTTDTISVHFCFPKKKKSPSPPDFCSLHFAND